MTYRRCVVAGGGPAGLALAVELLRRGSDLAVEVYDEPAPDGTGIVLESGFVEELAGRDARSGAEIARVARRWDSVRLRTDDTEILTGGHVILGIGRRRLLDILRERALELGAVVHRRRFDPAVPLSPGDLLVGADGAGSGVRGARADEHGPSIENGATRYLWMWADAAFAPGFWFRRLGNCALVAHVYPYEEQASAVIVECTPQALRAAGLDVPDTGRLEDRLTGIFAGELAGARLRCSALRWRSFRTVANRRWRVGDQVLIGDAAHTTHFTVGSGTRLAIEDAVALADALCADPRRASLDVYERDRRPQVESVQREGRSSQQWFEHIDRHIRLPGRQLAFALRTRRDVNTYSWLKSRDPGFVQDVLATVAADPRAGGDTVPAAPRLLPLRLGPVTATSRLALILPGPPQLGHTPAGIVFRPAHGAEPGQLAVPSGVAVTCREDDTATATAACVLLIDPWPVVREHLVGRRSRIGQALGAVVDGVDWRAEDAELLRLAVDFVVVRATGDGRRVERTGLAEHLRNTYSMTVLLWAPDLTEDEADTLIAAGRMDGYLHGLAPVAPGPRSADQKGILRG